MPNPPPVRFPGYPAFVEAAAAEFNLCDAAVRVGRAQPAVNKIATLVSQLTPGEPVNPDTMRVLTELSDGLKAAARAGEAMIAFLAPPPTVRTGNGPNVKQVSLHQRPS